MVQFWRTADSGMTFTARICLRGPGYVMYVGHLPPKAVDELDELPVKKWALFILPYEERRELRKRMRQPRWYGAARR